MTEDQLRDLLEHHRYLPDAQECSCQAYHAYGPTMSHDQWIEHVIDDAKTRGMLS